MAWKRAKLSDSGTVRESDKRELGLISNELRDKPEAKPGGKWTVSENRTVRVPTLENADLTLEETAEIANDPELWAPVYGRIEDRLTKDPIPWKPTILQRRMIAHYRWCQERNVPCRMVVVKIRRGGGSTAGAGLLYIHCHNYRSRAGVIGTDYEVSQNLHRFLVNFDKWDQFPGWCRSRKVLETGKIEWPNGSFTQRYTAENPEAARSAGLQGYHASEVARWQDTEGISAKETLRSMRGAVPRRGFTYICEESTANGASGAHYNTWVKGRWPEYETWWKKWARETPQNAHESGGDLQFVRIFAGWFEDEEAQMPCTLLETMRIQDTLDKWEKDLIREYGQDGPKGKRLGNIVETTIWEQLKWRREVIAHEFDGDREAFDQENPSSPEVAFRSSGRASFNRQGCQWMLTVSMSRPKRIGFLSRQEEGGVVFTPEDDAAAFLEVYEEPRINHRYIIGCDTMTGKEQIAGSNKADFNAAVVVRCAYVDQEGQHQPAKIVCALLPRDQSDPDLLAEHVDLMSDWYGHCMVVFEINNSGQAVKEHFKRLGTHVYRRIKHEKHTQERLEIIGWETNDKTRPMLISSLQVVIRANAHEEQRENGLDPGGCLTFAEEAGAMIRDPKGKDTAPSGKHDDHVIAAGLAVHNQGQGTLFSGHRRRKRGGLVDGWKRGKRK